MYIIFYFIFNGSIIMIFYLINKEFYKIHKILYMIEVNDLIYQIFLFFIKNRYNHELLYCLFIIFSYQNSQMMDCYL